MPRNFDQIISELAALMPCDFEDATSDCDGVERLEKLVHELMALPSPERGVRALFEVMERMGDSDLGIPGPVVHTLEAMPGHYESELAESLRRKPVHLSVWMVNRILNGTRDPELRQHYFDLLGDVSEHPGATDVVRDEALYFIELQVKKAAQAG